MAITIEDFDAARKVACECLLDGNALIHTANQEPLERMWQGGQMRVIRLPMAIVEFCKMLDAGRGKIDLVVPYIPIADEPLQHGGMIEANAHQLAWRFAHRIWLSIQQVLIYQVWKTDKSTFYDGEPGCFQFDRDLLDAHWEPIRDDLRKFEQVAERLIVVKIGMESAKARAGILAGGIDTPPKKEARLTIVKDAANPRAVYDGVSYPISADIADLFQALVDADGVAVNATDYNIRTRHRNALVPVLRGLIEKDRGKGCWIPREKLWLS